MKNIRTYNVVSTLPEELRGLQTLANNLWWTWDAEAITIFERLDRALWSAVYHNPVLMLAKIDYKQLQAAKTDKRFMESLKRVLARLERYMTEPAWFQRKHDGSGAPCYAYFSLEFGIHECLPIYSGGLGVLAGDHLKSASDLGVPLVGVGLIYRRGYFHQHLNADGWQQEFYPENDFANMPLSLVRDGGNKPVVISVDMPGRKVHAQIWKVQVGRVPLYLLDSNLDSNQPADREITATLYGGDHDMRMRQEILLGIGGVRALQALGVRPAVCHMNEGHSAFLGLERIRLMMKEQGVSFAEAREAVSAGTAFTTHTPVPAGIDVFHADMVEHYFHGFRGELGLERHDFLALGRHNPQDHHEGFNMAVLCIRLSAKRNGVSQLHGGVSRKMWNRLWPEVPAQEVPIEAITNGVHTLTWLSRELAALLDTYMGDAWRKDPTNQAAWQSIGKVPDAELWKAHQFRREKLVTYARLRLRQQLARRAAPPAELAAADEALDPNVLTIGFARRFATYKRATLLLRDPERLKRIVNNPDRPVQIIIAGKAHPHDGPGKELMRQIVRFIRQPEFAKRIIFIEDYDVNVARYMTKGCDVWLNNPRRPLEASGTSGMKAAVNGVLNVSILDGWWCEADCGKAENGWAIGNGEEHTDPGYQDDVESRALYDLLEKEIVPAFYERDKNQLPSRWITRMKNSIRTLGPVFSTDRMVQQYAGECYVPLGQRYEKLTANRLEATRHLLERKRHMAAHWGRIQLAALQTGATDTFSIFSEMPVTVTLRLDGLSPEQVVVQACFGPIGADGKLAQIAHVPLKLEQSYPDGAHRYTGAIPCQETGRHGFTIRVLPHHPDLGNPFDTGLVFWG
jgi:starch phosphorylase